jgi:hypothetical protein
MGLPGLGAKRRACFLGPFRDSGTVKSTTVFDCLASIREAASAAVLSELFVGGRRLQKALMMSQIWWCRRIEEVQRDGERGSTNGDVRK